jgi:uncharacterized protein YbdZ (MbtH family)
MSSYDSDREDTTIYKVVVNHEEQYSIWPADRENALGWKDAGKVGPKAECLAYIKDVWTDMRPLSLRLQMEEAAKRRAEQPPAVEKVSDNQEGDTLVDRLSAGEHPVEASLRPKKTVDALKERIDMGYVHIKFTDTQSGTELGVKLDRDALDVSQADFDNQMGTVHLEGGLVLNSIKVRCVADIDLQTLNGKGHLVPLSS